MAVTACGGDSSSDPIAPDPDPDGDGILTVDDACPNQAETFNNVFDTDGCPDTPLDLYLAVRADVEAYWQTVWQAAGFGAYPPISTFRAYTTPINSPCGILPTSNAFYCTANSGVYYDSSFLGAFLNDIGDMAPAFIISHEIGHHISWLLGWWEPLISTKEKELQADCFSGVWARSADDRGLLDEGDLEEAVVALVRVGDPVETWFDPTLHGTPAQRVTAFVIGYNQASPGCTSSSFFDLFPAEGS